MTIPANAYTAVTGNSRTGTGGTVYWRTPLYDYMLVTQLDWKPVIWRRVRSTGVMTSKDLSSTVIGLVNVTDSHCCVSMGVDPDGYIHVSNNTHDTKMRRIVSNSPYDITSWTEAPKIPKQAKIFTNLVENGVVELNTDGWSALDSRFTLSSTTHGYGWGSSVSSDPACKAALLTRTSSSPDTSVGAGVIKRINGANFTATAGEKYWASLSMRCYSEIGPVNYKLWIVFRNSGGTELSRVVSATQSGSSSILWYRCFIDGVTAPANTAYISLEFLGEKQSGNSVAGTSMMADGAMLFTTTGDGPSDIVYRDGAYNGGEQASCWVWNGTPYASTSTGPLETVGYAGINMLAYDKYQCFSDGSLLLTGAQPIYPNNPVGRRWSAWIKEAGDTNFKPFVGLDGILGTLPPVRVLQGAPYSVSSYGNPANDISIPDRTYIPGIAIDKHDVVHAFGWFRLKTSETHGKLWYIRSSDRGATWESIDGDPVTIPLEYTATANLLCKPAGQEVSISVGGSVLFDNDGRPGFIGSGPTVGRVLIQWDGTQWVKTNLGTWNVVPTGAYVSGRLMLFGNRQVDGVATHVAHDPNTGATIRLGAAVNGTPDGDYQFENQPVYQGVCVHAGGLDAVGNYVYTTCLPNGNSPRIVSYGNNARSLRL